MPSKLSQFFKAWRGLDSTTGSRAIQQIRACIGRGDLAEAERICQAERERHPENTEALFLSADVAVARQDLAQALSAYSTIALLQPAHPLAIYKRANLLSHSGQLELALADFNRVIALDPTHANAYCNRGVVLERLGRTPEAIVSYDRAIAINPADAFAHHNRAGVRARTNPEGALADYDRALALRPDYLEAECNKGVLLIELQHWDTALASFQRCIEINPHFSQAQFNKGALYQRLGRFEEALKCFDIAIRMDPRYAEAYSNRGAVLTELGRWHEAVDCYDTAISLNSGLAAAFGNRAGAMVHLNRHEEAIADYDKALSLDPQVRFVIGARLNAKMHLCDWRDFNESQLSLKNSIEAGLHASHPFHVLGVLDSPRLQQMAAAQWVSVMSPQIDALGEPEVHSKHRKIRVGYFSPDFRDHAVAHLVADLFDYHDRSEFELFGFSLGPNTGDAYRKRFEGSFDQFFDVRLESNLEIAKRARGLRLDVAVDLGGHTSLSRPGVFALRAAPIQVNYLGYPGTMAASYFDYVIADKTLVPESSQIFFTEKVIYLPHSYQANSARTIADSSRSRTELGLPERGFVFCCFNNNFKISPTLFDRWMRILISVPGSVLWLLQSNDHVVQNLKREASARMVDPRRLVFAPRMLASEHLARHCAADLFLDTLPYNAHTTASDALMMGLPLLTCMGDSFASRVAASLLRAVGLPELVTASIEQYEELAIELGLNSERLAHIKEKLVFNRRIEPLFDIRSFTRDIETAYKQIIDRYRANGEPTVIHVLRDNRSQP